MQTILNRVAPGVEVFCGGRGVGGLLSPRSSAKSAADLTQCRFPANMKNMTAPLVVVVVAGNAAV